MFGAIINLVAGPFIGLAGSALTKWQDAKAEERKMAHELAIRKADAEIMAQEWAQRTKVAEVEAEGKVEVEDSKAFAAAISAEAIRYSQGLKANTAQAWLMYILDFVRGMVRPSLTLYLCLLATLIYLQAREAMPTLGADPQGAADLVKDISLRVMTMTEAVVFFWFGTRKRGDK